MKSNTPNTSIFSITLSLDSPWYVADVQLLDNNESFTKVLSYIHMLISQEVINLFYPMVVQARVRFGEGHWSGIVNYFDTKLTNGILVG